LAKPFFNLSFMPTSINSVFQEVHENSPISPI